MRSRFLIPLALGLWSAWSAAAVTVPVRVSLRTNGPAPAGLKVRLHWTAVRNEGGSAVIEVPGTSTLDLAPGMAWTIHAQSDGFWSEDRTLTVREDVQQAAEILLFPAGSLTGSFDLPPGQAAPPEVAVRFRPAPAPRGSLRLPEGTISCPVAEGTWRCRLPAGDLDLRLKAGPYTPVYLWGVAVQAAGETPAGALRLRPGAAVVGWVETPEGAPAASCRVELNPQPTGVPVDHTSMSRLEALLLESRTNDRGFFQLEAVPPGRYTLKVTSPGLVAAEVGPIEVRSGLEAEVLDRIVLQRPVRFEALLDPPLDPYGQPWKIVLQARPPASAHHEGRASMEGIWSQPDVAPGPYTLGVLGDQGARWWTEEVEAGAGQARRLIQVPLVEIRGRLRQGDDPLSATLWFGGLSGVRRIRFDADEDGEFEGFLPEEGLWKVELVEADGGPRVGLEPVEVRKRPGARRAEVEITVPDTTLAGEVVDEEGKAVAQAFIQVDSVGPREEQKGSRFEADAEGKFRIRGLAPGPASVEAEAGERTSGWSSIVIADEGESPWLRLVVRSRREVRGRVFSLAGAVPGARIQGFPDLGGAGVATGVEATSDPSGQFSFGLPAGARAVHLQVFALGYAFRILRAFVDSEPPLQLPLESQGGTLILERAEPDGAPSAPLLFHAGSFVPVGLLRSWVQLQRAPWTDRGPLVIPGMEIGEYALCTGRDAVAAAMAGAEPPASACSRGVLVPYGELLLKTPSH